MFNPEIARLCNRRKIAHMPGCGSATEISQAEELGVEIVKVFLSAEVGGPGFVKAVLGPMPWTCIMPTGGADATGCGFFGNIHLEGWSRIENAPIVAVVDTDQRKAEEAAGRFDVAAYTDLEAALAKESPDFADIATRPDFHLRLAKVATAQGCHVLCQKPIAPAMEESVKLVETCNAHV